MLVCVSSAGFLPCCPIPDASPFSILPLAVAALANLVGRRPRGPSRATRKYLRAHPRHRKIADRVRFRCKSGHTADITAMTGFDPTTDHGRRGRRTFWAVLPSEPRSASSTSIQRPYTKYKSRSPQRRWDPNLSSRPRGESAVAARIFTCVERSRSSQTWSERQPRAHSGPARLPSQQAKHPT